MEIEKLEKYISDLKRKSVLDLGCGKGLHRDYFSHWVGVDEHGGKGIVRSDILDYLKSSGEKFDLIVCEFVLQQNKSRAKEIVDEIYRHLSPSGYFYLASFNHDTEVGDWFTEEEYQSFIRGKLSFWDRYIVHDPPHGKIQRPHTHSVSEVLVKI